MEDLRALCQAQQAEINKLRQDVDTLLWDMAHMKQVKDLNHGHLPMTEAEHPSPVQQLKADPKAANVPGAANGQDGMNPLLTAGPHQADANAIARLGIPGPPGMSSAPTVLPAAGPTEMGSLAMPGGHAPAPPMHSHSHAMSAPAPSTGLEYPENCYDSRFVGLDTLAHAVEQQQDGMYDQEEDKTPAAAKGKRRYHSESLQLDLDEDQVISELHERGLINQDPTQDPKTFKGGRPPLGMGPYKRVKEYYDRRMITMENWRIYYADKCRECGYEGAFRKDLRPRLNAAKGSNDRKRAKTLHGYQGACIARQSTVAAKFPASDPDKVVSDAEMKLVKTLARELQYRDTDVEKFVWDRTTSDEDNVRALCNYLQAHRPTKSRRGKKPEGIAMFPIVFDLWSLSLIESSQFKRISKYAGVDTTLVQPPTEDEIPHEIAHEIPMMQPEEEEAHAHPHPVVPTVSVGVDVAGLEKHAMHDIPDAHGVQVEMVAEEVPRMNVAVEVACAGVPPPDGVPPAHEVDMEDMKAAVHHDVHHDVHHVVEPQPNALDAIPPMAEDPVPQDQIPSAPQFAPDAHLAHPVPPDSSVQ